MIESIDLTDAGVKLISQSFDEKIQNLNLLKLDIGKDSRSYETANDIDYKAIGYLRYQMELNSYPVLLVLRLKQNKIGDIGCKILAQIMLSVKGKENLRELDLAENEISSSGFYHLSLALVIPSALQKLHLQNNKIMARGALLLTYNYLDNLRLLQKLNQHRSEKIKDFNGVKLFVNDKCFY
ncbi:protein nlrc5 [Stylonychia lemnae]|uniref:Protein nlrc5 n=1 Tax=Stylonychia lemnae TaxID=5949 RepID=A0A077ZNG6_STYLE|nr:protein nlrc5 [Stylonychia lemnae]|eukprot:CDW71458.1 protein nlrc5 [Stylonychia lemnae]